MPKSVHSPAYDHFRALLIEARKAAGMSQGEMAAILQRPQSFVSKVENGERRLDVIEFLQLAQVLDVDAVAVIQTLQHDLPAHS